MPINKLTFAAPITDEVRERFMSFVSPEPFSGCWLWTGAVDPHYGRFTVAEISIRLPRAAWLVLRGPIPEGLEPDHLCRLKPCANPDHMELVTHRVNVERGDAGLHLSTRTHCPQGHEYAGENLVIKNTGARRCRECSRFEDERKRRAQGSQVRATHCTRGHLMEGSNVIMQKRKGRPDQRLCVTCRRLRDRSFRLGESLPEKLCRQGRIIPENLNDSGSR